MDRRKSLTRWVVIVAVFQARPLDMNSQPEVAWADLKVFNEDINRLLAMDDLWNKPGRVKPVPLESTGIMSGSFQTPPLRAAAQSSTGPANANGASGSASTSTAAPAQTNGSSKVDSARLRDQRVLTLKDNLELFIDR
jgi:ubiquitin-like 1-activating enzyme E1 B